MRADALRPLTGPGSTDTLAAIGGLDLPGHELPPTLVSAVETIAPAPEPIPGERDATTLTVRQPGAIGGRFSGADTPSVDPSVWIDKTRARELEIEGGGGKVRSG